MSARLVSPLVEQDRIDALDCLRETFERYAAEVAIIRALDTHRLQLDDSINLGYYRTFIECSCGAGWWFGDHEGDPSSADRWLAHRARVIEQARS